MADRDDPQLDACVALAASGGALGQRVKEAMDIVEDALASHGEDRIAISFNGGKDCTVLLHVYAAVLYRRHLSLPSPTPMPPIQALYIAPPAPFPQLESFIHATEQRYGLHLFQVAGADGMKSALEVYKRARPGIEAIFVGTRKDDPHGGTLEHTAPTDPDWPRFLRVHPILNWTYADIWTFLRHLNVSYCALYDSGYTSLGSTYNTYRNPALCKDWRDGGGEEGEYRPAYELEDSALERAGRTRAPGPPLVEREPLGTSMSAVVNGI